MTFFKIYFHDLHLSDICSFQVSAYQIMCRIFAHSLTVFIVREIFGLYIFGFHVSFSLSLLFFLISRRLVLAYKYPPSVTTSLYKKERLPVITRNKNHSSKQVTSMI